MRIFFGYMLITLLLCAGCGEKLPEGMPKPYPVKVKVMMNNVPLEGAEITAYPTNPDLSKWAGASAKPTNSSGQSDIYTYMVKGLPEGEYILTVEKQIIEAHPEDATGNSDLYELFVDPEFWNKDTSPLKIDVSSKNKNLFTVEVKEFNPDTYDQKKHRKRLKK